MDDIKISIPILRKYMKEDNAVATDIFLKYINRRQLSAATGIEYRRLCRLLRKEVTVTTEEVSIFARIIKVRHSVALKFIAQPIDLPRKKK
jgi:hypothetical protein